MMHTYRTEICLLLHNMSTLDSWGLTVVLQALALHHILNERQKLLLFTCFTSRHSTVVIEARGWER